MDAILAFGCNNAGKRKVERNPTQRIATRQASAKCWTRRSDGECAPHPKILVLYYSAQTRHFLLPRRGAGVAEQGCLLSSYTPKGCRGFESAPLRQILVF